MGKIIATYDVKVTLRESDDEPTGIEETEPTIAALEAAVESGIEHITSSLIVRASATRTDK